MKSLLALVALALAAMALVPSAQAHIAPPRPDFPLCQDAVVGDVCFSPYWPGCNVWIEWTAIPLQSTCLYRSDPVAASAAGPDVQCMDVYSRTDVHTISVVRTNSCAPPEFYQCPTPGAPISTCTPLLGLSAAAALPEVQEPQCYSIYREYHVGPVTVVQRSSCHAEVLLCGERDFTQVDPARCPRLLETASALDGPDLPPMHCYDIYSRWGYGPVYVVMTSSCSGYVELCGEPAQYRDLSCLLGIRAAADPGVQCMDVYSETYLGAGYWLVRRDSCSAQVYQCPEGYSPPAPPCQEAQLLSASAAAAPVGVPPVYCMPYEREVDLGDVQVVQGGCGSYVRVCGDRVTPGWDGDVGCVTDDLATTDCYAIYRRVDVGPAALVMTSSCSGHLELCGDRVSPTAAPDLSCVVATSAAAGPEPQCLQVYREHTVGPVHYVSRDSCHSEVDVCGDDAKALTGQDPAALADCAVNSWGILA